MVERDNNDGSTGAMAKKTKRRYIHRIFVHGLARRQRAVEKSRPGIRTAYMTRYILGIYPEKNKESAGDFAEGSREYEGSERERSRTEWWDVELFLRAFLLSLALSCRGAERAAAPRCLLATATAAAAAAAATLDIKNFNILAPGVENT